MGKRGEVWVVIQFIILAAVGVAPLAPWVELPAPLAWVGFALMAAGGLFGAVGALHLGESLSAFPKPIDSGRLVTSGAYALVRHPIYAGLLLAAVGWALWNRSALCLLAALVLAIFFDAKSRREERWLSQKYPDYEAYRRRVRKLVPFVY